MFGWIAAWMTPPSRICTPRTTSSSDCVQPFSVGRVRVDEREHDEPDATASSDWKTATKKFARYCSSFSAPRRR